MGISAILRNRLFLIWVFGLVPLTSLVHLGGWYVGALVVYGFRWKGKESGSGWGWMGKVVYWCARMGLVVGCLMGTFWGSLEAASPFPLDESL